MLQKFKNFLSYNETQNSEKTISEGKSAEEKIIDNFEAYIKNLEQDSNTPKKMIENLKEIHNLIKAINFDDMTLEDQSTIRRIIESEIKIMADVYFSLPKAHAVSVILENGKTAKETLIENVQKFYKKINEISENSITAKTELLLKRQKIIEKKEKRKDFFDL